MKKCIENSGYNIEPTEQGLAKFIVEMYNEFIERTNGEINAISENDYQSLLSISTQTAYNEVVDPTITDSVFDVTPLFDQIESEYDAALIIDNIENFIMFNNEGKLQYNVIDVINNILTNYSGFSEKGKILVAKLKEIMSLVGSDYKVIIQPQSKARPHNVFMLHFAHDKTIRVFPELFSKNGADRTVKAFIHELVHAITVQRFRNPQTFEDHQLVSIIQEGYRYYKEQLGDEATDYGFKNELEFMAELFSNDAFFEKIQSIENKNKVGWFDRLINAIRRVLGLKEIGIPTTNKMLEAILKKSDIEGDPVFDISASIEINDSVKIDKSTPKKRLDAMMDNIEFSIKENIRRAKEYRDRLPQGEEKKFLSRTGTAMHTLLDQMAMYGATHRASALVEYVDFMNVTLAQLLDELQTVDRNNIYQVKNIISLHSTYVTGFSVIDDVSNDLSELQASLQKNPNLKIGITLDNIATLENDISIAKGMYSTVESKMLSLKKEVFKDRVNDIQYWPQIEMKHRKRLEKEHADNKIQEDRASWVTKQLNGRDKYLIKRDVEEAVTKLVDDSLRDIYSADVSMSTPVNISSPLISIMNQFILEIEEAREENERRKDREFKALFEKLRKEKGSNLPKKLYANLIGQDKTGQWFLEGKYKASLNNYRLEHNAIYDQYYKDNEILNEELSKADVGIEKNAIKEKKKKLRNKRAKDLRELKQKYFIIERSKIVAVRPEYINNKQLTETEKEVRDFFLNIVDQSEKKTFGKDSLKNSIEVVDNKPVFAYSLPRVTQRSLERILSGDVKGIVTDKWQDLTTFRPDDLDYVTIERDQAGNVIRKLRVHFRDRQGTFDNKAQSLDLFGIMRLEYKNTNVYNTRVKSEMDLNFLLDIAQHKTYYQRTGTSKVLNWRNRKLDVIQGNESNTYKMMTNLMESRFYDIMKTSNTKIGSVDVNKAVSLINGASAFLALSLNFASGTANVLNAQAQMFLESFIKGKHIKAGSIAKANKIYSTDLPLVLADVTNPIASAFSNQIMEMFNVRGEFNLSQADFLKSDMIKKGLSIEAFQVFQESGEHWIQSIITMSVLDGIKVMNANGDFINKKGEVVKTEKEAASLLDMMERDEAGIVTLNPAVVFTTHTPATKWTEGGRNQVTGLLIKKMNDSIGNYRKVDQPNMMRGPLGALLMLYRKYFIPMGQARFRGIEYFARTEESLDDDQRAFSFGLKEYEEGTYTTLARYIVTSIKNKKQWLLFRSNWNKMSDYQRHNVKRAIGEFVLTWVMLPLAQKAILAMAGDDNEEAYFLLYELRRLDTELSQYFDPAEAFKMIRSPIPSARLLETAGSIFTGVIAPWSWQEKYVQGPHKGESKLKVKIQKQIPVLKEFRRTFEDLYDYQNSSVGTGL